jgi:hypothetical protein
MLEERFSGSVLTQFRLLSEDSKKEEEDQEGDLKKKIYGEGFEDSEGFEDQEGVEADPWRI